MSNGVVDIVNKDKLSIVNYINHFKSNADGSAPPRDIGITKHEHSIDIINGWEAGFHSVFIPMITIMNSLSGADDNVSMLLTQREQDGNLGQTVESVFGVLGVVSAALGLPAVAFAVFGLVATMQALAFHKENYRKNLTQFGNTLLRNLDLYTQLLELHTKPGIPLKFTEEYKVLLDDCFVYFFKYLPQEHFYSVIQDINNNIMSVQGFDYNDFCSNFPVVKAPVVAAGTDLSIDLDINDDGAAGTDQGAVDSDQVDGAVVPVTGAGPITTVGVVVSPSPLLTTVIEVTTPLTTLAVAVAPVPPPPVIVTKGVCVYPAPPS